MTEEPLIYTTKGNLPIASLTYKYGWDDKDDNIVFWEEYWDGDELVKRGAHAYLKQAGVVGAALAGKF